MLLKSSMALPDDCFSLARWKRYFFREGQVYYLAGRLKKITKEYFILSGQGVDESFKENLLFQNDQGEKIHKSAQQSERTADGLKPGDHLLLKARFSKGKHQILNLKKILSPQRPSLNWDPEMPRLWFSFIKAVENFFISEGFCPVETPSLVDCPGTEPHLQFFSTLQIKNQKQMWLASSPEMHLKKLLCRGATDIFEIHKSYRNNESGPHHLSEFYLLEWYRAYAPPSALIKDLENLFQFLFKKKIISSQTGSFKKYSVKELFQKYCDIQLTPRSSSKDLWPALKKADLSFRKTDSFEDLFFILFLNQIEPKLNPDEAVIIYNYPPSLRAYARLTPEGWAHRFEFYWKGFELANAFFEIFKPEEQSAVFKDHLAQRKYEKTGCEEITEDQNLLLEMEGGMPPCSGIALGLERLFMAIYGLKDITRLKNF